MSSEPALYSLYMPSRFEIIFALVLLPFVILTLPTPAFAHATPIQYVPDASSVLSQPPAEVRIHFSEPVEPNVAGLVLFADITSDERAFAGRFQIVVILGCSLALAGGSAYLIYKTNELATLLETSFVAAWGPFLSTTSARYTIYRMLGVAFILIATRTMH